MSRKQDGQPPVTWYLDNGQSVTKIPAWLGKRLSKKWSSPSRGKHRSHWHFVSNILLQPDDAPWRYVNRGYLKEVGTLRTVIMETPAPGPIKEDGNGGEDE